MAQNKLHEFLHAGNLQARPYLGQLFDWQDQTGLTGFFSQGDASLLAEVAGEMLLLDLAITVDIDQFESDNLPALGQTQEIDGVNYVLKTLKGDQSAYILGFKKIST